MPRRWIWLGKQSFKFFFCQKWYDWLFMFFGTHSNYTLTILCCSPHKIVNDEGKLLGLPWNRTLTDDHGVPYDIVCGTFFVAGLKEDDFASLTEQQIEKYQEKYSHEMILSVPKQPEAQKKPMKKEKHEYER